MRWLPALVILVAVLAIAVAFLPMRAVTAVVPGLEAESASGTIWSGSLRGSSYRGLPVGDVDHRLRALPLLAGRAELSFVRLGAELRGDAVVGGGTIVLRNVEGIIEVPLLQNRIPSAPPLTLEVQGANLLLGEADGCRAASGQVRAEVRGLPLLGDLPLTSGTIACDGDAVAARLTTPRRDTSLDLRGWTDGRWAADLRIEADDVPRRAALALAGFRPVPGGMAYRVEGGGAAGAD
ncbi:MAG: type II secretion system protein N [Thermaurantiacus sp.]